MHPQNITPQKAKSNIRKSFSENVLNIIGLCGISIGFLGAASVMIDHNTDKSLGEIITPYINPIPSPISHIVSFLDNLDESTKIAAASALLGIGSMTITLNRKLRRE
jgi:EamA domain-containing membrane protein RarD